MQLAEEASPAVQSSADSSRRLYYIDWLRVLLIFGVFLFHAVHPFDAVDWHIKNDEQSVALSAIMLVLLYPWGLPLFFLIAGAGSKFALQKRTGRHYVNERVWRLLIPFIVGSILLTPLQEYLEALNKGTYEGSLVGFVPEMVAERFTGYSLFSPRIFGKFGFHLWFLGFLFAYSLLALPIFLWFRREGGRRFIAWLGNLVDQRGGIFIFIIPLTLTRFLVQPFFPVEHDWADFIYTFIFFISGYIVYSDHRFLDAVRRDRWLLFGGGVLSLLALFGLFATGRAIEWFTTFTAPWSYLLHFVFSITSWCWAIYVLYLAMVQLNFTNKWLVYGNETIMPFFLLHQPVIIVVSFFVVQWNAGILVKLPIVVVSSFVITLGLVELLIRPFRPIRMLFGMKPRGHREK